MFSYFYVSVMVAMKDLPATPFGCLNGCMEIPEHKSSLNSEGTCYCVVCAEALTKPETLKSVGCTSMQVLKWDTIEFLKNTMPNGMDATIIVEYRTYYCQC